VGYAFAAWSPNHVLRVISGLTALSELVTPDPEPEPEPEPMPSELDIVTAVRAKYPTPLGAQHAAFLVELVTTLSHGAGLLLDAGGNFIQLSNGVKVEADIVCYPDGTIYDCLGSSGEAATPQWGLANGSPASPSRYYRVTDTPEPAPVPEPSGQLDRIEQKIDRLLSVFRV